jgi:hypothetical protein
MAFELDTRFALETYIEHYGDFGLPLLDESAKAVLQLQLRKQGLDRPLGESLAQLVERDIGLTNFLMIMALNRGWHANALIAKTPFEWGKVIESLGEQYVLTRFSSLESVSQLFTSDTTGLSDRSSRRLRDTYRALYAACEAAIAEHAQLLPGPQRNAAKLMVLSSWIPYLALLSVGPNVADRFMRAAVMARKAGVADAYGYGWENTLSFTQQEYVLHCVERFNLVSLGSLAENNVERSLCLQIANAEAAWRVVAEHVIVTQSYSAGESRRTLESDRLVA